MHDVVLVGGSTRIPKVQGLLQVREHAFYWFLISLFETVHSIKALITAS